MLYSMATLISFVRGVSRLLLFFAFGLWLGFVQLSAAQSSPMPEEATVEKIADGFQFAEGPIWCQGTPLFSDIPANTVYQWAPGDSSRVFLKPSVHANGLAVGPKVEELLAF